jgi:hypothetical protein
VRTVRDESARIFQGVLSNALTLHVSQEIISASVIGAISRLHGIMYVILEVISSLKRRVQMRDNAHAR